MAQRFFQLELDEQHALDRAKELEPEALQLPPTFPRPLDDIPFFRHLLAFVGTKFDSVEDPRLPKNSSNWQHVCISWEFIELATEEIQITLDVAIERFENCMVPHLSGNQMMRGTEILRAMQVRFERLAKKSHRNVVLRAELQAIRSAQICSRTDASALVIVENLEIAKVKAMNDKDKLEKSRAAVQSRMLNADDDEYKMCEEQLRKINYELRAMAKVLNKIESDLLEPATVDIAGDEPLPSLEEVELIVKKVGLERDSLKAATDLVRTAVDANQAVLNAPYSRRLSPQETALVAHLSGELPGAQAEADRLLKMAMALCGRIPGLTDETRALTKEPKHAYNSEKMKKSVEKADVGGFDILFILMSNGFKKFKKERFPFNVPAIKQILDRLHATCKAVIKLKEMTSFVAPPEDVLLIKSPVKLGNASLAASSSATHVTLPQTNLSGSFASPSAGRGAAEPETTTPKMNGTEEEKGAGL